MCIQHILNGPQINIGKNTENHWNIMFACLLLCFAFSIVLIINVSKLASFETYSLKTSLLLANEFEMKKKNCFGVDQNIYVWNENIERAVDRYEEIRLKLCECDEKKRKYVNWYVKNGWKKNAKRKS